MQQKVDKIIIGAGIYGLYAALYCMQKGEAVVVLEHDEAAFKRASSINQARVHQGYHYPRAFATAQKCAEYFNQFTRDYGFCINKKFDKIYAISTQDSKTSASDFKRFCDNLKIKCDEADPQHYFAKGVVQAAFLCEEHTYDADILCDYFIESLKVQPKSKIVYNAKIKGVDIRGECYSVKMKDGSSFEAPYVLNATYASVNQVNELFGLSGGYDLKYELCEMLFANVSDRLAGAGLTVMDGPFFSIMPFGKKPYHSIYSVEYSRRAISIGQLPIFECMNNSSIVCTSAMLANCTVCPAKPETAFHTIHELMKRYLREDCTVDYLHSHYTIRPILLESQKDDSRPTVVKIYTHKPAFVSVLSGKIDTVYDINDCLEVC